MIPHLTPLMQSELTKESSMTLKKRLNSIVDGESNDQNFPVWEENFQDLSGWCMDQFPEQSDFPTGETINSKLTGLRTENEVSTMEGVPEEFTIVYDENRHADEDIFQAENPLILQPLVKFEHRNHNITSNKPNVWLNTINGPNIDTNFRTDTTTVDPNAFMPLEQTSSKLSSPAQVVLPTRSLDPLEPIILSALGNNEAESFDLLSYVCDDQVTLPSTSTLTSPSVTEKINPVKIETTRLRERRNQQNKSKSKSRSHSSLSSSSSSSTSSTACLEESVKLSERINNSKNNNGKLTKDFFTKKRRGVKRMLKSDSEDQDSDHSYRESREKNNEASRKSRMNKKAKEIEMTNRANQLEEDNRVLKMKVEELEKLVISMRMALLQSALKRER